MSQSRLIRVYAYPGKSGNFLFFRYTVNPAQAGARSRAYSTDMWHGRRIIERGPFREGTT